MLKARSTLLIGKDQMFKGNTNKEPKKVFSRKLATGVIR